MRSTEKDSAKFYAMQAIRKLDASSLSPVANWVRHYRGAGDKELINLILLFGTPSQTLKEVDELNQALKALGEALINP